MVYHQIRHQAHQTKFSSASHLNFLPMVKVDEYEEGDGGDPGYSRDDRPHDYQFGIVLDFVYNPRLLINTNGSRLKFKR